MGKYDIVILKFAEIGWLVQRRTARETAEQRWACVEIRIQFKSAIANSNEWKVPVYD